MDKEIYDELKGLHKWHNEKIQRLYADNPERMGWLDIHNLLALKAAFDKGIEYAKKNNHE